MKINIETPSRFSHLLCYFKTSGLGVLTPLINNQKMKEISATEKTTISRSLKRPSIPGNRMEIMLSIICQDLVYQELPQNFI